MYKIGELSKLCCLPVKTLRFYDHEGLLVPDEIDRFSGYRYYSAAKLADCNRIIALKELGFTLDEIKKHLNANTTDNILALIEAKYSELETQSKQINLQLKKLDSIKQIMKEGEKTMFEMIIKNNETIKTAVKREIFATKADAHAAVKAMRSKLGISNLRSILINYETEYREKDFDLAVCAEIIEKVPKNSMYDEKIISLPGNVASIVCNKTNIDEAYRSMTRQLDESGFQVTGAFYEIYHDETTVELKVPVCKMVKCNEEPIVFPPFENDTEVIGKWKLLDIVPSKEQFIYGLPKCSHINNIVFNELYFLENGEKYWVVEGWSKGVLYTSAEFPVRHPVENRYEVETISGRKLLFVGMTQINAKGMQSEVPHLWVYEKVSSEAFKAADIKICDNIDYPFILDENVLGNWAVCDFYAKNIESFDPNIQKRNQDRLYVKSIEFIADGQCIYTTTDKNFTVDWTKGLVLNKYTQTAPAYKIISVDNKEYLLLEWKSGDYTFGGRQINWYVFTRA